MVFGLQESSVSRFKYIPTSLLGHYAYAHTHNTINMHICTHTHTHMHCAHDYTCIHALVHTHVPIRFHTHQNEYCMWLCVSTASVPCREWCPTSACRESLGFGLETTTTHMYTHRDLVQGYAPIHGYTPLSKYTRAHTGTCGDVPTWGDT